MAHWDVSSELRGRHGRWSKSADALKRMGKEAETRGSARAPMTLETAHSKMLDIQKNFGNRQGYLVNGFTVHHMEGQGLRVRMPGKTVIYKDPREAAVAVFRKQHHEEGHSPIPLPGGAPELPKHGPRPPVRGTAPRPAPELPKAPERPAAHLVRGAELEQFVADPNKHNVIYGSKYIGIVRKHSQTGEFEAYHKGKYSGTFASKEEAANSIVSQHLSHEPAAVFPGGITPRPETEKAVRELATPRPRTAHPKSITIGVKGYGPERNQQMRAGIIHASTIQATSTPDMVSKTTWKVTHTPHGHSKTGTTLASSMGSLYDIHMKPHVLIADNAQKNLEHNKSVGWWVPTDHEHSLSTNVGIHEYGHGTHGLMHNKGLMQASRGIMMTTKPEEMKMWNDLSDAIGIPRPPVTLGQGATTKVMQLGSWFENNKAQIKKAVSTYGGTNLNEMIAELWTEHKLSSSPRAPARVFGSWVENQLKGKRP